MGKIHATLDFEMNCDSDVRRDRTDYSIIEVGLVVYSKDGIIEKYQEYVKPIKNDGKLYSKIIEYTGIQQETIDTKGVSFEEALSKILALINKYEVSIIYTYGQDDAQALTWNLNQHNMPDLCKDNIPCIYDYRQAADRLIKKDSFIRGISLETMLFMLDCPVENSHSALDDAISLYTLIQLLEVDKRKRNEDVYNKYKRYCQLCDAFYGLLRMLRGCSQKEYEAIIRSVNAKRYTSRLQKKYIDMIRNGQVKFISFQEYLDSIKK